jgi:iron-sulfur cluster assembly protein
VPIRSISQRVAPSTADQTPGGIFFIDGASVLYLVGSTMDWKEDDFSAGFVFDNPNAKGSCGCGQSFNA